MPRIRCYVDFNTMMQFSDRRVILGAEAVRRLGNTLCPGLVITVFDEDQEADGIVARDSEMEWWVVVLDNHGYREVN